jgi:hypothetical protein
MHTLGRTSSISSVSSTSSISSRKSVSFDASDKVYYTHGKTEYDRSAKQEDFLCASLGKIYLNEEEEQAIVEEEEDHLVDKNTFANGRRNAQGYAVVLGLKYGPPRSFS